MSQLLPEDAWLNSFQTSLPRPLLVSLQKRLTTSTTHLSALADIYKERAAIEANYAAALNKLAKSADQSGFSGKVGNDWDKSSGEAKLWNSVVSEISEVSLPVT
jgi:hypothetical protein